MAVSRPVLLALLGAVLIGALYFATMGGRDSGGDAAESAAAPTPTKPAAKAKSKADSPGAKRAKAAAASTKTAKAAKAPAASAQASAGKAKLVAPQSKPAAPKAAAPVGVPAAVTKALADKRVVVLFFYQRGSADDDATGKAVDSLRGRSGVKVFSAPITRLADFRGVTGGAGVSQAPAVVILGREGSARLIEGYVDSETLAQEVADAR
jgi:cytoskeletal protein RodZ